MSVYTGSCLCGSVTYEADGEPRRVFECYCNWCQKITSGSAREQVLADKRAQASVVIRWLFL